MVDGETDGSDAGGGAYSSIAGHAKGFKFLLPILINETASPGEGWLCVSSEKEAEMNHFAALAPSLKQ